MNRYNIPVVNRNYNYVNRTYNYKYIPRFILRNNFSILSINISRWENVGYNKISMLLNNGINYIQYGIRLLKVEKI